MIFIIYHFDLYIICCLFSFFFLPVPSNHTNKSTTMYYYCYHTTSTVSICDTHGTVNRTLSSGAQLPIIPIKTVPIHTRAHPPTWCLLHTYRRLLSSLNYCVCHVSSNQKKKLVKPKIL